MTTEAKLFTFLNRYDFLLDSWIDDVKGSNMVIRAKYNKLSRLKFIDRIVELSGFMGIPKENIITFWAGHPNSIALNPTIFKTWSEVEEKWKEFVNFKL